MLPTLRDLFGLWHTKTLAGSLLLPSPLVKGGEGSVIPAQFATYAKRKSEPKWFDATQCIDAAERLKVHNLTSIAGLGTTTSPADVLRNIRNLHAHRGNADGA